MRRKKGRKEEEWLGGILLPDHSCQVCDRPQWSPSSPSCWCRGCPRSRGRSGAWCGSTASCWLRARGTTRSPWRWASTCPRWAWVRCIGVQPWSLVFGLTTIFDAGATKSFARRIGKNKSRDCLEIQTNTIQYFNLLLLQYMCTSISRFSIGENERNYKLNFTASFLYQCCTLYYSLLASWIFSSFLQIWGHIEAKMKILSDN